MTCQFLRHAAPTLTSTRTLALLGMSAWLLGGCPSSVLEDFDAAKAAALADPGAPGANWRPDAVVSLSEPLLDGLLSEALKKGGALKDDVPIKGPLGMKGMLKPNLVIDSLEISPSTTCESCLSVDAEVSGDVGWVLGPARGTVPLTAVIGIDTELNANQGEEGWEVYARPDDLRQVKVDLGGGGRQIATVAEGPLKEWLMEALKERTEPVLITRFDAEDLPMRAIRLLPADSGLRVEMLTNAPDGHAAKAPRGVPESGWRLDIAPQSLLALARRASFEAGPVSHDVVIEPTGLSLSDDSFDMDIRLWRIKGKGWWRDYHTEGDLALEGPRIKLTPTDVEERGKSPGAVLVDPLAALGHGVILKAIEDSLATSVPGVHRARGTNTTTVVRITSVDGTGAMVRLAGELEFKDRKPPATGGGRGVRKR